MSYFKELIEQDNATLLGIEEFGEIRTIMYDGNVYENVSVLLTGDRQKKRFQMREDHAEGLYLNHTKMHCRAAELGEQLPEKGSLISISRDETGDFFKDYYVAESVLEVGMLLLYLEAIDE